MNLESLKNILKSKLETAYYKITDSAAYNILLEKYESLDIRYQKWTQYIALATVILMVLAIPIFIGFQSYDSIQDFKLKKSLIFKLLQRDSQPSFESISSEELELRVSAVLSKFNLSKEAQIQSSLVRIKVPTHLNNLRYSTTSIQVEQVNIGEAVNIGAHLDQISPTAKVLQFKIVESEKENYFNVIYSLVHFKQPQMIKPLSTKKS